MPPQPSGPAREPVFVDEAIALARIEAIARNARATWLVLIGLLAFIGSTLLSVRDVDFFSATAATSLPIVNIAISTTIFFWTAAWLAAVLHTYLHLFLLKLWDALAEAPPEVGETDAVRLKLGERVFPWLVNDWALRRRPDHAANDRPMDRLSNLVTTLVIWLATPLVLAGFWWRSMPAHDAMLTLAIAGALLVSLFASLEGWRRAQARLGTPGVLNADPRSSWELPPRMWGMSSAFAAVLVAVSFMRTEVGEIEIGPFRSKALWLAPIDLAGAEIVEKPDDWVGRDTAERRFRMTWCRDRGLPADACEPPTTPVQESARIEWCQVRRVEACADRFREIDNVFDDEWQEARGEYLANFTRPDLSGRDMRGAHLGGAFIAGVSLREARLERADLTEARLEGADLGAARLEGADLSRTRLEGADLFMARLQGANLTLARLEGADVSYARLEGSFLGAAQLKGANLRRARLDGANLYAAGLERTKFNEAWLTGANLSGAWLGRADLTLARLEGASLGEAGFHSAEWAGASIGASLAHSANFAGGRNLTQSQLDQVIGNDRTILPLDAETGEQLYVWTCWAEPPLTMDGLLRHFPNSQHVELRAQWLCPEGVEPERTGRPEALPADR